MKQALGSHDFTAARAHLEAIRRVDRSYSGLAVLETSIRDAESAAARARESSLAEDKKRRDAQGMLERSRGLVHAEAIELLKQAAQLDANNREIPRELARRESEAAAEAAARRSPAAENAARTAIRQVLAQFTQVFNGDNRRKADGFKKLWPSMTPADLATLNGFDTDKAPMDWTGNLDRAEIRLNGTLTTASVTWTITFEGRDPRSRMIMREERTSTFELTGGPSWVITRVTVTR